MSLPPGAREVRRIGGGDINEAFRAVLADGREAFVKTRPHAPPGEYALEAAALRWLAEPGALRTPRVFEVADGHLALEWIEPGALSAEGAEELGRGLAATHAAGASRFGRIAQAVRSDGERGSDRSGDAEAEPGRDGQAGAGGDAYAGAGGAAQAEADGDAHADAEGDVAWLGTLRLSNEPTADWPSFYAERRLRPLGRLARDGGRLAPAGAAALERVCERMAELSGPQEPPARLHGDLWQGNVLAGADGRPWLIDPAAYGGHREVDLAMLTLFGSPPGRVLESYCEAAPLADGWQERVASTNCCRCSCTRCCSAALTAPRSNGWRSATAAERLAARPFASRPARAAASEQGTCNRRRSQRDGACTCWRE